MRVLCVNDLPPGAGGGTEVHLQLLLDGLRASGASARAFDAGSSGGPLQDVWNRSACADLEREIRSYRPDVLHFHNVVRELSTAVLRVRPDLPRVLTVHDGRLLGDPDGQGPVLRALQRAKGLLDRQVAKRCGAAVLAVSGPLQQRLEHAGFTRVRRAWPWSGPPAAEPRDPLASRDIAFVGRLDVDKGVDLLVEAFLRADRPGARLLLAGQGSYRPPSDERVVPLGQLDRQGVSRMLGSVRAVALASVPSRRPEGAPMALVEGLVHGRPLLVSDDPGCAEVARVGSREPAGLVLPAGDRGAWADGIGRLLDDDDLVAHLAAGARAAAPAHLPAAGLARVKDAYAEVLR